MHQAEAIIANIYYGFNLSNMFVRIDTSGRIDKGLIKPILFSVEFIAPRRSKVDISIFNSDPINGRYYERDEKTKEWNWVADLDEVAAKNILEIKIPFNLIKVKEHEPIHFVVKVKKEQYEVERKPDIGYFSFNAPDEHYEAIMWKV